LQTRTGKRSGGASVRIAVEMVFEKLIDKATAVKRVTPEQLDQLLHPTVDPKTNATVLATGLPASPGAAQGQVVFSPDEAEEMARELPEGRHAVPDAKLPILGVADRLVINRTGPLFMHRGTNVAAAIAWTQRQLVFEHRPLGEVAEELNRYNRGRIRIDDAQLLKQEITGTFQSNDTASFIDFLSNIPGVVIREDGNGGRIVMVESSGARQ
jgi:hypothetical protein